MIAFWSDLLTIPSTRANNPSTAALRAAANHIDTRPRFREALLTLADELETMPYVSCYVRDAHGLDCSGARYVVPLETPISIPTGRDDDAPGRIIGAEIFLGYSQSTKGNMVVQWRDHLEPCEDPRPIAADRDPNG